MAYKKPQDPLTNNGFGIYPLTTADQVILSDGSRLEKNGLVSVDVATAVNSEKLGGKTWAERLLDIYPIGSIYMSVNSTSPAALFGGEWEQLKDKFLLGAGGSYLADSIGGEATHKLTIDEMPIHGHYERTSISGLGTGFYITALRSDSAYTENSVVSSGELRTGREYQKTDTEGGSQPHNNMPPYMAVYMWKRVS